MSGKRKRAAYATAQKLWLIDLSERDPSLSTVELGRRLAEHVNEGRSRDLVPFEPPGKNMIIDWKRDRKELRKKLETHGDIKKSRSVQFPQLEEAMHIWVVQMEQRGAPLMSEVLLEQAKTFGAQLQVPENFSYSNGWLDKFKKCMGLKAVQKHGEAGSAPMESVDVAKTAVPLVIQRYSLHDV